MEDAHACVLDLQVEAEGGSPTPPDKRLSFFGVYDGHGGDKVAIYAGDNLHKIVAKQEAFKEGDLKKALQDGFLATDRAILSGKILRFGCEPINPGSGLTHCADPKYEEEVSGCTASVGIISKDKIYVVCTTFHLPVYY